jgi:hypothetical protein
LQNKIGRDGLSLTCINVAPAKIEYGGGRIGHYPNDHRASKGLLRSNIPTFAK